MPNKMRIEFEWLDRQFGSEIDRAFFASIGVAIGEEYLTRIDDLGAKTVSNHMRGCAFRLATWFAANWWRLRWEPEAAQWWKDTEWRLAHSIAAAGGGYVWPNAVFASDGHSVEIASSPKGTSVPFEPIRYINHIHARIPAIELEQRVDEFLEGVLSRLNSLRLKDDGLAGLWAEVLAERSDPVASERRKLEAMAGYDPDEAPDNLLEPLIEDKNRLGKGALEEVAAAARHSTGEALKPILELAAPKTQPSRGGYRVAMPGLETRSGEDAGMPWQRATRLAEQARQDWGLGRGPVSNQKIAGLLGVRAELLTDETAILTEMPIALRTGSNGTYDVYLNRPRSTTRRFAISRLIGDHLYFENHERLRPATRAKTSRQKFQRAFAQAFLCPFQSLVDRIQTQEPDEDDISEAAAYFDVSPLMVRTTLVNKGELDREALTWKD